MDNEFKDIPGYEGIYLINRNGVILSKYRNGKKKQDYTIKKHSRDGDGYHYVSLYNKKQKNCYVHRLVMETFCPNPNPEIYTQVNHKDCNIDNNNIDNLEWVTSKENSYHAIVHGLWKSSRCFEIIQYDFKTHEEKARYITVAEASRCSGIQYEQIRADCDNDRINSERDYFRYGRRY